MAKKRNIILIVLTSLFTLAAAMIFAQPYLPFKEGSFIWAALYGLNSWLSVYVGYFDSVITQFTLVPFVILWATLLFDSIFAPSALRPVLHSLGFVSLLCVIRILQGDFTFLPSWAFYVGCLVFAFSLLGLAFERVYLLNKNRVPKPKKEIKKSEDKEAGFSMTVEEARHYVASTIVPEFTAFPMVPIHDDSATIGGSVNSDIYNVIRQESEIVEANREKRLAEEERLSSLFQPKNLTRKIQQDREAQGILSIQSAPYLTQMDEPKKPVLRKTEVVSKPAEYSNTTIVDEGSPEGDPDEARRKYEQMIENSESMIENGDIDFVSGVAGLSSGKAGRKSYLINAEKYKYKFPSSSLLKHYNVTARSYADLEHDPDGHTIVETLRQFRIETQLMAVQHGPTFTLYELQLAPGIRVNSVQNYADNIAMNLAVSGVRILAPIPGKIAIGIEVPNKQRDTIGFDVMYQSLKTKALKIPFVLGRTITGESVVIDLAGTPHLLIAGTTGSGKSVSVNSLICSVLYTKTPAEVRMILVDPKMVELSGYNGIPHLLTPVITQPKRAIKAMSFIIEEMERRMQIFKNCGAKKIEDYNRKIEEKSVCAVKLPYIMVIIDEFADLMMVVGKELESYIQRITQIARFTGIHLVLATQRPSVDVITGIIKSNIPSRIAFAVSDVTNSKIIIDKGGAEKLLGRGDMLYLGSSSPEPIRIQGAYIDPEIESIVEYVKKNGEPDYIDESYFEEEEDDEESSESSGFSGGEDMFTGAWKIVSDRGEASASYLQRKLNIGYNRAATLIEKLEEVGYIGPARGSKPREILRNYIPQEFED